MKRTGLLFFIFSLSLFGMSYETFKAKTLKNSKILKSQSLALQTAQQKNSILLRASNPVLNLELSNYNAKRSVPFQCLIVVFSIVLGCPPIP